MQINTGLFASAGLTEQQKAKKFTVHDLTTHSSKDEPHIDDQLNNLIDINLKSDIFDKILSDEDEAHLAQVKAINLLSAAMHNVVENLHSLDFKIHNHRYVEGASTQSNVMYVSLQPRGTPANPRQAEAVERVVGLDCE